MFCRSMWRPSADLGRLGPLVQHAAGVRLGVPGPPAGRDVAFTIPRFRADILDLSALTTMLTDTARQVTALLSV